MTLAHRIRKLTRRAGIDIIRYPGWSWEWRRARLLEAHGIDLVLDVGANEGIYVKELRDLGYRGRAVSFEPVSEVRARLELAAAADPLWTTLPWAVGDVPGKVTINIAGNAALSSSILDMRTEHVDAAPTSAYVATEEVEVRRLDDLRADIVRPGERPFLKIDVQGYERHVLDGAEAVLAGCVGLQLEVSMVPLYAEAMLLPDVLSWADAHDFEVHSIEPGFSDRRNGRMLQADLVLFRPAGWSPPA